MVSKSCNCQRRKQPPGTSTCNTRTWGCEEVFIGDPDVEKMGTLPQNCPIQPRIIRFDFFATLLRCEDSLCTPMVVQGTVLNWLAEKNPMSG